MLVLRRKGFSYGEACWILPTPMPFPHLPEGRFNITAEATRLKERSGFDIGSQALT